MTPVGPGLWLFLVVVAFCVGWFVVGVALTASEGRRLRDGALALAGSVAWIALFSAPTALGWATPDRPLPAVPIMMGSMGALAIGLALSPLGRRLAHGLPLWALIGFQGMRLPLEIVLHLWGEQGVAPPQMTWSGQNLDVVTGVVSLMIAPFADRSRILPWVAQIIGIALLLNVLRIVATSLPTPLQQFEEPLLLPFSVPAVWIAGVCVFGAILVHALTLRRLLSSSAGSAANAEDR